MLADALRAQSLGSCSSGDGQGRGGAVEGTDAPILRPVSALTVGTCRVWTMWPMADSTTDRSNYKGASFKGADRGL
jgi:hypothetical protein